MHTLEFESVIWHKKEVGPELGVMCHLGFEIIVRVTFAATYDTSGIVNKTNNSISNKMIVIGGTKNHTIAMFCVSIEKDTWDKCPNHTWICRTLSNAKKKKLSAVKVWWIRNTNGNFRREFGLFECFGMNKDHIAENAKFLPQRLAKV